MQPTSRWTFWHRILGLKKLAFGSPSLNMRCWTENDGQTTGTYLVAGASYLLRALQISITTSTDKAIVLGWGSSNISQSTPLKRSSCTRHCMWCVYASPPDIIASYNYCSFYFVININQKLDLSFQTQLIMLSFQWRKQEIVRAWNVLHLI